MRKVTLLISTLVASMSAFAHDGLHFNDPYARATPPNAVNSAVFMTIENHMKVDRELVSASTDVAEKTELHTVEKEGDMMKMRQIDRIGLPAQKETVLKPGSYHIMLLNVKQPLTEGNNINVDLAFANGEIETIEVPIKKVMSGMKHKHAHKENSEHSHH